MKSTAAPNMIDSTVATPNEIRATRLTVKLQIDPFSAQLRAP